VNGTSFEPVAVGAWREQISTVLAGGARFGGAWASGQAWRALILSPGHRRVLSCDAPDARVDTIVDFVEAAAWDEREAHDLHGLEFTGHDPMRPLAAHPDELATWTTPVSGDGVHQVAVGPIHAGVIESGHFRFHVVGERILTVDPRLFYKHRGLERAATGLTPDQALAYAGRACAACAATNTIAYASAVEDALGRSAAPNVRIARTLLLELERLYNHLHDISAICAGVGFAPGTMTFAALKDRAQQVNADLTGHRFMFGAVAVARSDLSCDEPAVDQARSQLRDIRSDAAAAWRDLEFAGSMQARLDDIGILSHDDALRLGAVGPAARAADVDHDARTDSPQLWYSGFAPARLPDATGDVAARLRIRVAEIETSCDLLDELLATPIEPGVASATRAPTTLGVGIAESPRGQTTCTVEVSGQPSRIERLHLRTGSYANWPAVAHAAAGNLLPDFPLINKSFELCYACVDR
jgi:Ni,Fe-hydrogenase III large subunit